MPERVETAQGPFWCWPDIVRNALAKGEFWDQQIQPTIDSASRNGWALDLGANIGWFTVYMARRFDGVVALEAHPATYELLLQNLVANQVADTVVARQLAAYARAVPLRLATGPMMGFQLPHETDLDQCTSGSSVAFYPETHHPHGLVVQGMPVDDLIQADLPVTFIKVDVQGCDLPALRGLARTIRRCRPLIVFEYEMGLSIGHGDTWQDHLDFFAGLDYAVQRIREDLGDYVARPL